MGRVLFPGFLNAGSGGDRGVTWHGQFASWAALEARGRDRAELVRPQRGYLVDPSRGLEGFASFFAVATVPDTLLIWAEAAQQLGTLRELAPGLYEIDDAVTEPLDRPLWGILTSGSSGTPRVPVGYADMLELVALHYNAAIYRDTFADGVLADTLATCLPLAFSAAFFMMVLPALFFRRDLVVFAAHDWRPLCEVAAREHVICQSVPAITAAGCLSTPEPADMSRAALYLGAGYVTSQRVRTIRKSFRDVTLVNIYGTAETGAIAVDRDPGNNMHVGRPIPGKPVWLQDVNEKGIGRVATTGPDCRQFSWTPGGALYPTGAVVASTDYGHFDAGYLYLDGRVDEGEKLHGITIYPRLTERHLLSLDGVADVRVLVLPGPEGRDQLVARVVGALDEAVVRAHCAALPGIQRPARVECIAEDAVGAYSVRGKL
jgi:acyl-coenzyme A synthetase/AMP-(fatty) acid ligase